MSSATDLLNSPEAIGEWTLDPNRSSFSFTNKTMWGLMNVKGSLHQVQRDRLGVIGNMAGMIPKTTTLLADAVFRRAGG